MREVPLVFVFLVCCGGFKEPPSHNPPYQPFRLVLSVISLNRMFGPDYHGMAAAPSHCWRSLGVVTVSRHTFSPPNATWLQRGTAAGHGNLIYGHTQ